TSWVLAENLLDTYQDKVHLASRQASYLRQVQDSLTQWYIHHAGAIDRVLAPAGMKRLLPRLGLPLKWDLGAASSNRIQQGGIAYHVLAVWIPGGARNAPRLDPATGQFQPGSARAYALVNGQGIELAKVRQTRQVLEKDALFLEEMFKSDELRDADHREHINYFLGQGCSDAASTQPACLNFAVPLVDTDLPGQAGMGRLDEWDAWGGQIEVGGAGDSRAAPPFSLSIQSVTPWNRVLRIVATQPM
ncbi:MAG: hypothetical protein KGL58_04080, partial [Pseudomonadota bacterium]|nr:hypothetical protein [Pseudomonadota bacterium]